LIRQTLIFVRLTGHDRAATLDTPVSPANGVDVAAVAERLIQELDKEPNVKSRIAGVLLKMDQQGAATKAANGVAVASSGEQPEAQSAPPTPRAAVSPSTVEATQTNRVPATVQRCGGRAMSSYENWPIASALGLGARRSQD
jgi:hypothetical protein